MNPAAQLMCLCQGEPPIEDYVLDFIELAHSMCLIVFFVVG